MSIHPSPYSVAVDLGLDPNDRGTWPNDLIDRLLQIYLKQGWEAYQLAVAQKLGVVR